MADRKQKTHELKAWPEYFDPVRHGIKGFEIRRNDRDFKVGQLINLKEWDPEKERYTGREEKVKIQYITDFQQKEGYIVMGIAQLFQVGRVHNTKPSSREEMKGRGRG